jgi:small subunit ribosomal protein S20
MPIIKSAKKRLKQNRKNRTKNFPLRSEVKSSVKKELQLIKDGKVEEAQKFLAYTYKVIDMACKKGLVHANNAARKKSQLAKALNELVGGGGKKAAPAVEKSEKKAEKAPKKEVKEEAPKEEPKEEKEEK